MAILRKPLYDDGPVNAGEKRLQETLVALLPDDYIVIPNLNISIPGPNNISKFWEYDCIVIAPHGIYHIENKDWNVNLSGGDWAWFRNGVEIRNPHRSAGFKSKILAGKIKNAHPDWRLPEIVTIISLSNPQQNKFGLDPQADCYKMTFTVSQELIRFLTDSSINRNPYALSAIKGDLADYLTGQSQKKNKALRTRILNMDIEEVLDVNDKYTEFLCSPTIVKTKKYKVREYQLHIDGKSPMELEKLSLQVQNAQMAQDRMQSCPYIVHADFQMSDDNTYFYEKIECMDECTLRSMLTQKTFKQTDKISIILDIANALKVVHQAGVTHRDVCPENIYITGGNKAQLANFATAWFEEHADRSFTVTQGANVDSPYTAPELIGNECGPVSDIFSLGVIFYELMVGRLPFDNILTFTSTSQETLPKDMMPSQVCKDLPQWMDEVVSNTITRNPEKRWLSVDELISHIQQSLAQEQSKGEKQADPAGNATTQLYLKDMKPGVKITPSITLHDMLGKGGFGKVFKAWHDIENKFMAVKIFEHDASVQNAINEYKALDNLNHPNIVKFIFTDRTIHNLFYTLMELLDGNNLQEYARGQMSLPPNEIYQMAKQILSALVYMQELDPPVYHRDIKPNNIVWHRREQYKLIDFNIATDNGDKSVAGTYPYMAPDLVESRSKMDWDRSADTFSLGITIYELLTHTHPWPSGGTPTMLKPPEDIRNVRDNLTEQMADFVMKSIRTDRTQRYRTAREMLDALLAIGENGIIKQDPKPLDTTASDSGIDPVDYLNSLYSQSRHGNKGTRASVRLNEFDKLTYTETKLDKCLIKDIKALKYKLIIITGNAGDGKTAFIHRIEGVGEQRRQFPTNNGSEFQIGGVRFQTNYDGSQDEDTKANDDVLREFLSPFYNLDDYTVASEGRVIAINEGRLVDFLSTQPGLRRLQDNIEEYFYQEGHAELIPGLMVINLNLRSVTASQGDTPSLLCQQVKALTARNLWTKCKGCKIADRCYIKYNVDTFQDQSAGKEVINRLEWLIRTIIYKRELHITMRDMRSMIAWMITRDYSCDEVKSLLQYIDSLDADDPSRTFYWQYYYFNITSSEVIPHYGFQLPSLGSNDRLIKMLRDTDVAGVSLPAYDRDLYYKRKTRESYIIFSDRVQTDYVLDLFNNENKVLPAYEGKQEEYRKIVSSRHKTFVRHQYFEGAIDFRRRLPYRFASKFRKQLLEQNPDQLQETMRVLAQAISKSEGYDNQLLTDGYLLLSSSNIKDPISKSYRRFPLSEFELFVNQTGKLTEYIEYESDSLTFRHRDDKFITLTISLDLYEMLQYIREGFSPSVNDLRGRFIELQIFKNLLESKTYTEILVTKNNRKFTVIRLDEQKRIVIEPLPLKA